MKAIRLLCVALLLWAGTALAQSQCSDFNSTISMPQNFMQDNTEHSTGFHGASTGNIDFPTTITPGPTGKCTYTSGGGANCNTTCSVDASIFTDYERGTLNAVSHASSHAWQTGSAAAAGAGASCAATLGAAAASCPNGNCSVAVSVTGGAVTATSPSGIVIFKSQNPSSLTCASEADPTQTTAGGGISDPCLGGSGTGTGFRSGGGGGVNNPDCSPIIVDVSGKGFRLTSAASGVMFDISGTGHPIQIAWTAPGVENAFLALPAADGLVHGGKELFGNFTPQPASPHPNGFLALADYDKPENGGNGDGVIDSQDAAFSRLRLWIDSNHDGVSQPSELHLLSDYAVNAISLSYFESRRTDDNGNLFRYRAVVNPGDHRDPRDLTASGDPGRWTYDVFFVAQ
jgi:hypothetical protein